MHCYLEDNSKVTSELGSFPSAALDRILIDLGHHIDIEDVVSRNNVKVIESMKNFNIDIPLVLLPSVKEQTTISR